MTVAFAFTVSTIGVLYGSLARLRNRQLGYLGGIVLLGAYPFVALCASQYADLEVGFYIMSAVVALALYDAAPSGERRGLGGFLVLAGIAAGFSAWSKNEGLLFFVCFVGLAALRFPLAVRSQGWKRASLEAALMAAGALPVIAVVAYFKRGVAPANYYLTAGHYPLTGPMRFFLDPASATQKLRDLSRYRTIVKAMTGEIVRFGGNVLGIPPLLVLYLAVSKVRWKSVEHVLVGLAVVPLMLLGHFFVYVTTPLKLAFHLQTSLVRLLCQLWPTVVFLLFMITSSGERPAVSQAGKSEPC
jgi:hypothetical protein